MDSNPNEIPVLQATPDSHLASELPELKCDTTMLLHSPCAQSVARENVAAAGCFGTYDTLREIGRGRAGVVYKAHQASLNRDVALMLLYSKITPGEAETQRFRLEIDAIAKLAHPQVVPFYELGELRGQHYLTMKWMEGGSLSSNITTLAREPKLFARILADVALVIGHAHRHGMLHCNLKPTNILFDARGVAHVTGFDPRMHSRCGLDETPMSMSTLQYISPEQAAGESEKLTAASDVFSLGVILYELLTGQTSFKGETAASVQSTLSNSIPVPPHVKNPLVDHDLEAICLKCLERLPADRYASAEELSMELTRWLHGEPILTRQGNPITRVLKWAKRGTTLYWVKNLSRNRGVK